MDAAKLEQLKLFVNQCKSDPSILTDPSISFYRDYLESLNAKLPSSAYKRKESESEQSYTFVCYLLNDEANADNDADDVADVTATLGNGKGKKSCTKTPWAQGHDEILVRCWLNTSKDPVVHKNQTRDNYWQQITNKLNEICVDVRRTRHQVKVHWSHTSALVAHFNRCYIRAKAMNKSGWCEAEYMEKAHEIFRQEKGKRFRYDYWWKLVHEEVKWNDVYAFENSSKKTKLNEQENYTTSTDRTSEENVINLQPTDHEMTEKDKRNDKATDDTPPPMVNNIYQVEKEKVELMKKMVDNQRMKTLSKLVNSDVSKMTDIQRLTHEKLLREYLDG